MTSRTPAEPAREGDRPAGTSDSPERAPAVQSPAVDGHADAPERELRPGDLGGQAPTVEPARPNWSRLNGSASGETAPERPAGESGVDTAVAVERRRVPLWLVLVLALGCFVADQASKFWAMSALEPGSYRPLIGDVLGFQLVFNSGAAFSLAEGLTWVFTIVAAVVAVVIVRVARNLRSRAWALVLAGLLGGTLGNLFDRLFREPGFGRGYVVDFINYNGYFVGNVADVFIVVAAIGMGVLTFIGIGFDGRRDSDRAADQAAADTADTTPAGDAPVPAPAPKAEKAEKDATAAGPDAPPAATADESAPAAAPADATPDSPAEEAVSATSPADPEDRV